VSFKNRITIGAYRKGGKPFIQWNHVDGPLLVCSSGHPHWLTLWERFQLFLGLTTIEKLNDNQEKGHAE